MGRFFRFTQDSPTTGLPEQARIDVQCRQPPMTPACGVDADVKTEITDFGIWLLCMADDHHFPRRMRSYIVGFKKRPSQLIIGLLVHRHVGEITLPVRGGNLPSQDRRHDLGEVETCGRRPVHNAASRHDSRKRKEGAQGKSVRTIVSTLINGVEQCTIRLWNINAEVEFRCES
jgi:hypothetical protein